MKPTAQPLGIPHQIPAVPIRAERNQDTGIRTPQRAIRVKTICTSVSPAPRSTPPVTNMLEKST